MSIRQHSSPGWPPLRLALALTVAAAGLRGAGVDDAFFEPTPFVQATAAFEQGDLPRAEALTLPLAAAEAASADAWALLGQIRLAQKRLPEAVEAFGRAAARKPESAQLRSRLGAALLDQAETVSGDARAALLSRAREELERAETIDPTCVDAQFALLRHVLLSPAAGSPDTAAWRAARVIELDPLDFTYAVADLAERRERFDLAERYYALIDRQFPGNPWFEMKRAAMLARLGQVDTARTRLEAILRRVPDFAPARDELARLPAP